MKVEMNKKVRAIGFLKLLGRWWPHVAVALVVPGGNVLAVLLWMYQRRQPDSDKHSSGSSGDSGQSVGGAA
jgi:nitrate reductase NapE component